MPSQLTRVIFRRLIANEPLVYHGCRYQTAGVRLLNRHSARALPQTQRRTFLDLFKPRRKLKAPEIPAGLELLGELNYALKTGVRPPPPKNVAEALRAFFKQRRGRFDDFYVGRAYTSLTYLLENPQEDGSPWFTKDELDTIMYQKLANSASRPPESDGKEHLKFGRLLLQEMARENEAQDSVGATAEVQKADTPENVQRWITLLCMYGGSKEAKDLVMRNFKYDAQALAPQRTAWAKAWNKVFTGTIEEGDDTEILKLANEFRTLGYPATAIIQRYLVTYFATRGDLKNAKLWYSQPVLGKYGKEGAEPMSGTYAALLKACALAGDTDYGQQVVTSLLKNETPEKGSWDAIFLYSAAIGKGVDEIERMMNVMTRRNDEARQKNPAAIVIRPDVDTINTLVEFANSREDPYTAERYIALGEKRGIIPNEKTYTLQIEYRLSVRDLDGARTAYMNMQGDFTGTEQGVLAVNKLIQALCKARQHHFDELMVMVDDLHERKAYFAPETVTAVCLLHLRRGETFDAKDLLQVHAHQFAPEQRRIIQRGLVNFIKDGKTSTADAWEAYHILRNVFQETPRPDRLEVLNEFFARKRSDMACHVFFHMRNHDSEAHSANKEVYVASFVGFARCADAESLELAHNQLKLDFKIDMDTELRNALMMAYAATGQNRKALHLWREICESAEGPSYNSIAIAFRSCEAMHMGHEHAKSIWRRLKEQDVEIDKTIWIAYMSATTRNHQHDEALALIETVEEEYGFKPDLDILGNWFNMTASSEKQRHVEAWIKERYPLVWAQMEGLGHWVTMDGFGYRQFNINRDLDP